LGELVNFVNISQKQKGETESLTNVNEEKSKGVRKTGQTGQSSQTIDFFSLPQEERVRIIIDHLTKILNRLDTLESLATSIEQSGYRVDRERLLEFVRVLAEQGLLMVTEKALEGKRIVLVRLLRR